MSFTCKALLTYGTLDIKIFSHELFDSNLRSMNILLRTIRKKDFYYNISLSFVIEKIIH